MPTGNSRKRRLEYTLPQSKRTKVTANNLRELERTTANTVVWVDKCGQRHEMPKSSATDPSRRNSSNRSTSSSKTSQSAKSNSIYGPSAAFHMERAGVMPLHKSNASPEEQELRERLNQERASMSPPMSPSTFEEFQRTVQGAANEASLSTTVLPHFMRSDRYGRSTTGFNVQYSQWEPFPNVPLPTPDAFDGLSAASIHPELTDHLGSRILPAGEQWPGVPNFTLELKGPQGPRSVAKRQIVNNNAVGLQSIQNLRSYSSSSQNDGEMHSFGALLDSDSLEIYGTFSQEGTKKLFNTRLLTHSCYTLSPEDLHRAKKQIRNARELAFNARTEAVRVATNNTLANQSNPLKRRIAPEDIGDTEVDTDSVEDEDEDEDNGDDDDDDEENEDEEESANEEDSEDEWHDAE